MDWLYFLFTSVSLFYGWMAYIEEMMRNERNRVYLATMGAATTQERSPVLGDHVQQPTNRSLNLAAQEGDLFLYDCMWIIRFLAVALFLTNYLHIILHLLFAWRLDFFQRGNGEN